MFSIDQKICLFLAVLACRKTVLLLFLLYFSYFQEFYTEEGSFGVLPPLKDDAVLLDLLPFNILQEMLFDYFFGGFMLHQFFATGLRKGHPFILILVLGRYWYLVTHLSLTIK